MDDILVNADTQKKKIDEHEYHLEKIKKRIANQEDLVKRQNELDTERKILESKIGIEFANMRNMHELLREKERVTSQDVEQFVSGH